MKKVFGILTVACICIALGMSVRWNRERDVSLVCGFLGAYSAINSEA